MLWDLADQVLRHAGVNPWVDPVVLAVRLGFDVAVGPEPPTAYCVVYAWDQRRDERGWNVYQALAKSLMLREGILGGAPATARLARLLAVSTRCPAEALARQRHCPSRVLHEALAMMRPRG